MGQIVGQIGREEIYRDLLAPGWYSGRTVQRVASR